MQLCETGWDGSKDHLSLPASRGSAVLSHLPNTVTKPHPMSWASSLTP